MLFFIFAYSVRDQPGQKLHRHNACKANATALGIRLLKLLRPAVLAQTVSFFFFHLFLLLANSF